MLLCLGAATAAAGSGGRMVDKPYQMAEVEPGGSIRHSNGLTFWLRAAEHLVAVTIDDGSGTAVPARVSQDVDGEANPRY